PTLYAPVSILERMGEKSYIPDYAAKKTEEVVDAHQKSFQKAYKAGVKIAMGTDASVFKHGLNLKELTLMCNLGMTPMEAIVTSTKESAKCLGWEKDIGTIEAGKLADIIIVNRNPLEDISVLEKQENIVKVLKDGIIVKG